MAWYDMTEEEDESYTEHYSVLVSTTGTAVSDFTDVIFDGIAGIGNDESDRFVRLSRYSNQDIHIAFRHHNGETVQGRGELYIDHICFLSNSLEDGDDGIAEVAGSRVRLSPNPATSHVTVSANEVIRNIQLLSITGHWCTR